MGRGVMQRVGWGWEGQEGGTAVSPAKPNSSSLTAPFPTLQTFATVLCVGFYKWSSAIDSRGMNKSFAVRGASRFQQTQSTPLDSLETAPTGKSRGEVHYFPHHTAPAFARAMHRYLAVAAQGA